MTIRPAIPHDLPRLLEIFALARAFMARTGNPHQWDSSYPHPTLLLHDLISGDLFVCLEAGRIVAVFVLRGGVDPTYLQIYEGAWPHERPYATLHRIASSGEVHGVFRTIVAYALQHYTTLRIDTHRDNIVMQRAIATAGFTYCGIIHCWNGEERLAYIKG